MRTTFAAASMTYPSRSSGAALRSAQHNRRLTLCSLRDDWHSLAKNTLQKEIQFLCRKPRRIRRVCRHDDLGIAIDDNIGIRRSYSGQEERRGYAERCTLYTFYTAK